MRISALCSVLWLAIALYGASAAAAYPEVWNSGAVSPAGFYVALAFGDTDGDGLGEIWGGTYSTRGKVLVFEEGGDGFAYLHDEVAEADYSGNRRIKRVLIGDTDQDGREEVIVVTGGSNPTDGLVSIWEHTGAPGENVYTRVYEYTTYTYLYQAALGDADNDGYPEVVLGMGGYGGYPLSIRRIEYDPGAETWVHRPYTSSVTGLALAPHVADLDGDGENELAYGSSDGAGRVVIFENTGPNTFAARFVSSEPLSGNVVSLASHPVGWPAVPALAAGSHDGDLGLWTYDAGGDSFALSFLETALGGPLYALGMGDDGGDGLQEILPAVHGSGPPGLSPRRDLRRHGLLSTPHSPEDRHGRLESLRS